MSTCAFVTALSIACSGATLAREDYTAFVKVAKANIAANFTDPSSLRYRGLYISKNDSLVMLCGELNVQDGYGFYIGFVRFFASDIPGLQAVASPNDPNVFERMFPSMCGNWAADLE